MKRNKRKGVRLKIIGVTGGIGSGKSSVSSILNDLGAYVIDADEIAKKIVKKEMPALKEITTEFGADVIDEGGELDRKKLGEIVFGDNEKLKKLNEITHKYIIDEIVNETRNMAKTGRYSIVVIDAPIPVEHGFLDISDIVLVIDASDLTRMKRIMERDNISEEEALKRINSQMNREAYLRLADHVIENEAGYEELEKNTVKLWMTLKEKKMI